MGRADVIRDAILDAKRTALVNLVTWMGRNGFTKYVKAGEYEALVDRYLAEREREVEVK